MLPVVRDCYRIVPACSSCLQLVGKATEVAPVAVEKTEAVKEKATEAVPAEVKKAGETVKTGKERLETLLSPLKRSRALNTRLLKRHWNCRNKTHY